MDVSFIFPCLNEEETLAHCINEVTKSLKQDKTIQYEILVADNGSTDQSAQIAKSFGARVVSVPERGYGAALTGGINAAKGEYVIFADADGSYRLSDTIKLYKSTIIKTADMGIASRMNGTIEKNAMPFLHRYLGTPILTLLINFFFNGKLSDCNSGFRCIKKEAFASWNIRGTGMEFASELLIKALKKKSKIIEIPSGLKKDLRSRPPYLRTWRDGMRHLLFILSEKPRIMEILGLSIIIVASILQLVSLFIGPSVMYSFNLFDYHTHALCLFVVGMGVQLYLLGCYIYVYSDDKPLKITEKLLSMDEGSLFFTLLLMFTFTVVSMVLIFVLWTYSSFGNLYIINPFLVIMHFILLVGFLSIGFLGIHIIKKAK